MIAYLIHCSLVWLIALLVFETWLRHTTFHGANRWYLNASALLGLLLPLYQPEVIRPDFVPALEQPMHQLAVSQQRIEVISRNAGNEFYFPTVLYIVALAGTALQLLRLLREGTVLLRLRRRATPAELFGYRVLVTGTQHGPFSAFGAIYLGDINAYTTEELRFILAHEHAHLKLRHSLDKSFMLLLRCIFWWHPLVYVFYSRLSLVQEFQADQPLRPQAPEYGRFLIDESLSVDGVSITHQFFHSPLKTRIRMLQRFATRNWQKAGYIAALTLLAAGSLIWTNKSLAHKEERNGNVITFNGNKFELGIPDYKIAPGQTLNGTTHMQIPAGAPAAAPGSSGGGIVIATNARLAEIPVKMNGATIYQRSDLDRPARLPNGEDLEKALIESYMPSLSKLPDGHYVLNLGMMIADAAGKMVYYHAGEVDWFIAIKPGAGGMSVHDQLAQAEREQEAHAIPKTIQNELNKEMEAGLESIRLTPAEKNGKPVVAYVDSRDATTLYVAEIKNGKVTAVNSVGP